MLKLRDEIAEQENGCATVGNNVVNMTLTDEPFRQISSGAKTVEVRLYDEKRRGIKVGDTIVFTLKNHEGEQIATEVTWLYTFPSFTELFSSELLDKAGFRGYSAKEAAEKMYDFYDQADEEKYGVLAIEIKVLAK